MPSEKAITAEEQQSLETMCQENGWLRSGGYPWQEDPSLREVPFSFSRIESLDGLKEFFQRESHAIREGVLFGNLAFINQVDGGDEWWTLKRLPNGSWIDIDSISFKGLVSSDSDFTKAIASLQLGSPSEDPDQLFISSQENLVWRGPCFPSDHEGFVEITNDHIVIRAEATESGIAIKSCLKENGSPTESLRDDLAPLAQIDHDYRFFEQLHKMRNHAQREQVSERAQAAKDAADAVSKFNDIHDTLHAIR